MRTNYGFHDTIYKRRKSAGRSGWDTDDVIYDNQQVLHGMLRHDVFLKKGRLLEIGCGAGDLTLWLAEQGFDVSGADISETAIRWARKKAQDRGIQAEFQTADVVYLQEYLNQSFDVVFDGHCLHCIIGADRPLLLANVRRVLQPGGIFLVNTMCDDPITLELQSNFDSISRCQVIGDVAYRYLGRHQDLLNEIETAGFQIIKHRVHLHENENDQDMLTVYAMKPETP